MNAAKAKRRQAHPSQGRTLASCNKAELHGLLTAAPAAFRPAVRAELQRRYQ